MCFQAHATFSYQVMFEYQLIKLAEILYTLQIKHNPVRVKFKFKTVFTSKASKKERQPVVYLSATN